MNSFKALTSVQNKYGLTNAFLNSPALNGNGKVLTETAFLSID